MGAVIGLIFGIFSMIQASVAAPPPPRTRSVSNPLLAVLPRMLIGPVAWLVWKLAQKMAGGWYDRQRHRGQPYQHGACAWNPRSNGLNCPGLRSEGW